MSGILPVNDNIIRPLLICSRQEIEEYLAKKNQSWCMDSTNEEDTYTRNRIRHHILKFADYNINDKATSHVANAAQQMASLRQYLEGEVEKMVSKVAQVGAKQVITNLNVLKEYHPFLQEQYWLWVMNHLALGRKDITSRHMKSIQELVEKSGSKKIDLPHNLVAVKEYENLRIQIKEEKVPSDKEEEFALSLCEEEESYPLPDGSYLDISYISLEQLGRIEENKYTKYFDYDKINSRLKVRFRQSGDYLTINDEGQRKSLKDYFIGEKIPQAMRDKIPLITDGKHILWVIGYRISAHYKVSKETKKVVKMTIRRDEKWQKESAFY